MSQVKLTADTGGGTTSIKGPAQTTGNADVVFKLPIADGSSGQVLKTDGSGQLSFTSNAGTTINNNADNRIITGSGTANTLEGEANCTFNGSQLDVTGTVRGNAFIGRSNISAPTADVSLYRAADNTLALATASTERMRIDSSGIVYVGGVGASATAGTLFFNDTSAHGSKIAQVNGSSSLTFHTGASQPERLRIDSSGRVYIGTTSHGQADADEFTIANTSGVNMGMTIRSGTSALGNIFFSDGTSGDSEYRGMIQYGHNNDSMRFSTSATERMRIDSDGKVMINTTSNALGGVTGNLNIANTNTNNHTVINCQRNTTASRNQIRFLNPNGNVGSVVSSGTSTTYNTSSDYRLKENEVLISDGITRLKQLKPYKFNFKTDSSTILDGFFAHEVSSVVPEAITGTKDAVVTQAMIDAGDFVEETLNDPIHQGIDQSKLVPLLTAALQEEVAKREALEARVAALEAA